MKICQQSLSVMTLNIEEKLEPHLCFFLSHFDLDESGLRTMICKFPLFICYSIANIELMMKFYEDFVSKSAAKKYCIGDPVYLSYSLEKCLKPILANIMDIGLVVGKDISFYNFAKSTNK